MEIREVLNSGGKAKCPYCSSTIFFPTPEVVHPEPAGRFLWWKWEATEGYLKLKCRICYEYCRTELGGIAESRTVYRE